MFKSTSWHRIILKIILKESENLAWPRAAKGNPRKLILRVAHRVHPWSVVESEGGHNRLTSPCQGGHNRCDSFPLRLICFHYDSVLVILVYFGHIILTLSSLWSLWSWWLWNQSLTKSKGQQIDMLFWSSQSERTHPQMIMIPVQSSPKWSRACGFSSSGTEPHPVFRSLWPLRCACRRV